ncbi:vomeronasal type-1 receptor 90-like [Lepus europaeus]|uniref:vomeronasal type-1 receptor 90-like n=1 Tax=Lepus europaeus TaxID=9983 RepID=UPI002B479ADC|nr:vomeronasal type-1 receptor 90-like [Lepus europaeus]
MGKNNILLSFIAVRNGFYFEVCIGITANAFLLLFHVLWFFLKHRPRPTDLTTGHLTLIHLEMLTTIGFIAADIFEARELWDDITCKAAIYSYQVMRGLSLGTTCLLSVLQAITLSPRSSCLAKFKRTASHHNMCGFLFLWVFNLSISAHLLISTVATKNQTSNSLMFVTKSCSLWTLSHVLRHTFHILGIVRDVSLVGLMALSSGYMVTLLCRHKRQSQHLHSTSLSARASPEHRATRTILLLMSIFVLLYLLDCMVSSFSGIWWKNDPGRLCVQMLLGNGYATICPFVLISSERRRIKLFKSMWEKEGVPCKTERRTETTRSSQGKRKTKQGMYLTPYTKINSEWIKHLNQRPKIIKLLKENTGEMLHDVRSHDKYFRHHNDNPQRDELRTTFLKSLQFLSGAWILPAVVLGSFVAASEETGLQQSSTAQESSLCNTMGKSQDILSVQSAQCGSSCVLRELSSGMQYPTTTGRCAAETERLPGEGERGCSNPG